MFATLGGNPLDNVGGAQVKSLQFFGQTLAGMYRDDCHGISAKEIVHRVLALDRRIKRPPEDHS